MAGSQPTKRSPGAAVMTAARRLRRKAQVRAVGWRTQLQMTDDVDVLVRRPVFVFSSIRSGSTLLRMVLDSHSQICAPHELHLHGLKVTLPGGSARPAMRELGLNADRLELMLWDRILLRESVRAQKSIVVDKTPKNTHQWARIARFWPEARFIFLLRHPLRVVESMASARGDVAIEKHYASMNKYAQNLADARAALPGLTVRYEDFTADPEAGARSICAFLGVPFEPEMLHYRQRDRRFVRGLGDWSANIKSGEIKPAPALPTHDEIPAELLDACKLLGYL